MQSADDGLEHVTCSMVKAELHPKASKILLNKLYKADWHWAIGRFVDGNELIADSQCVNAKPFDNKLW